MTPTPQRARAHYVVQVQAGSESRILRLLASCGSNEGRDLGMGYVSACLDAQQVLTVKGWRGVLAVLPSSERPRVTVSAEPTAPAITEQALVKLQRPHMAVVGRVKRVTTSEATVVFTILGRPVEQVCPLSDLQVVEAPEVWR